ncbi:MAG: acyl carrier protein [Planctomycetota bacterium]|nr:acyl carrier protein [Planctomycetota bacterium]MDA1212782.1 acyl carrier protein [Planctomycetota bacterium]
MIKETIGHSVREFVIDNFLYGQGNVIDQESFLQSGLIDSTGVLELVTFLEDRFQIAIDDEELVPDNLDSVERLVTFIETKLHELKSL